MTELTKFIGYVISVGFYSIIACWIAILCGIVACIPIAIVYWIIDVVRK